MYDVVAPATALKTAALPWNQLVRPPATLLFCMNQPAPVRVVISTKSWRGGQAPQAPAVQEPPWLVQASWTSCEQVPSTLQQAPAGGQSAHTPTWFHWTPPAAVQAACVIFSWQVASPLQQRPAGGQLAVLQSGAPLKTPPWPVQLAWVKLGVQVPLLKQRAPDAALNLTQAN